MRRLFLGVLWREGLKGRRRAGAAGAETSQGEREAGPAENQRREASRGGHDLSRQSARLAGVDPTHPGAHASSEALIGEGLALDQRSGHAVEDELRAQVGLASTIASIDRHVDAAVVRRRQPQRDRTPSGRFGGRTLDDTVERRVSPCWRDRPRAFRIARQAQQRQVRSTALLGNRFRRRRILRDMRRIAGSAARDRAVRAEAAGSGTRPSPAPGRNVVPSLNRRKPGECDGDAGDRVPSTRRWRRQTHGLPRSRPTTR